MLLQYKKYIYIKAKKYKNSRIKLMYNPNLNLKIK